MSDERQVRTNNVEEPELYEEPPRMTGRDAAGVILALVALTVIGVAGYILLTPGKGFADLLPGRPPAQSDMSATRLGVASTVTEHSETDTSSPAVHEHEHGSEMDAAEPLQIPAVVQPETDESLLPAGDRDHAMNCSYCGMFADKSGSHSVAQWSDGSHTHHDCWDCLLSYGVEEGLTLTSAMVVEYGSPLAEPRWLDASAAWYLYDTKAIKGSMPPFVAAFADRAAAEVAQAELGGELVDFAGLRARWE